MKIAVVFGGLYAEHDISIFSFKNFYADIQSAGVSDEIELSSIYYIMRNGKVQVSSVDLKKPAEFYFKPDNIRPHGLIDAFSMIKGNNEFVYLICDGSMGIDGRFTSIVNAFGLKGTFGSALSFGLSRSKFHLNQFVSTNYPDIKIPKTSYITCIDDLEKVFKIFENQQIIVKPSSLGSSIYTELFLCGKESHGQIKELIKKILQYDLRALVQEYIKGEEYGCYCMERKGHVEVLATKHFAKKDAFLSTTDKYKAGTGSHDAYIKEGIPAISEFSLQVFKDTDCQNLSRMDFIVTVEKEIYFLENNCNPALRGFIEAYKERYTSCNAYDMLKIFIENHNNRRRLKTDYHMDFEY